MRGLGGVPAGATLRRGAPERTCAPRAGAETRISWVCGIRLWGVWGVCLERRGVGLVDE